MILFLLVVISQMLVVALGQLVLLLPCYIAQVTTIFSIRSDALTFSCKLPAFSLSFSFMGLASSVDCFLRITIMHHSSKRISFRTKWILTLKLPCPYSWCVAYCELWEVRNSNKWKHASCYLIVLRYENLYLELGFGGTNPYSCIYIAGDWQYPGWWMRFSR